MGLRFQRYLNKMDYGIDITNRKISAEWIDINNAEPLVLNELTLQVRKPDGTMATNLKPITRCSIKIQENPEVKLLEAQRNMIEAMSATRTQAQNTGRINFVDASSWVGS